MERLGGEDTGRRVSANRVALASLVGTTIEWYDFFLYGTASALVFNQLFFPNFDPLVGTLAAFGTFAVGYISRPIGGVVFGHFGDRIGRKSMLVATLIIMGIATFAIGLLPTYSAIGVWAPILLITLRFCQGLGIGGEWGGAILMAVEYSPEGKRGLFGSWPQIGAPAGLLLGTGAFALFARLPEAQFLAWGWRIPFMLSIVLVGVGLFIRLQIAETPAFSRVQESRTEARLPIIEVLRTYPKTILLATGARLTEGFSFNLFGFIVLTYGTQQLGLGNNVLLNGVLIAAAVECITIMAFGALSDRIGRRPVFMGGAAFLVLFAFPFFWLFNTAIIGVIWLGIILGLAIGHGMVWGVEGTLFAELFESRVRYSGASLAYQLSGILASAPAPAIATALLALTGGEPWALALYLLAISLVSLVAVYFMPETYRSETWSQESQNKVRVPDASVERGG